MNEGRNFFSEGFPKEVSLAEDSPVTKRFAFLFERVEGLDRAYFDLWLLASSPTLMHWEKFSQMCHKLSIFPEIFLYSEEEFAKEANRIVNTIIQRRKNTNIKD